MANALSDLGLPQADLDYMTGGEEGDGTDLIGIAAYCGPREVAQAIWDDPPQLAALLAKEEPADIDEEEDLRDDADVEILDEQEINLGELVGAMALEEVVPGEDDTRQGGVIGLRRLAGVPVHHNGTDNFRRKRQAVTRPRREGAKAKEAMIAA